MRTACSALFGVLASLYCQGGMAAPVAFVDLTDAYEQSTALKGLIVQVDGRMQSIRSAFEAQRDPLLAEIEALKTTKMHVDAQRARAQAAQRFHHVHRAAHQPQGGA